MISRLMKLRTEDIIKMIREKEGISRVELAKKTGLSKPTISQIVNKLIHKGVIREIGYGISKSAGGRKPVHLSFVPDFKFILSVDIGGTKTIFSQIDLDGNILQNEIISSEILRSGVGLAKELIKKLKYYIKTIGSENILGISIGIPGTVDSTTNFIKYMPSFNIGNIDLKTPLQNELKIPVIIENDVTLFAFGEYWIGSAKDYEDVFLVSIGTGIGAGLVMKSSVYKGFKGSVGEIGEMITDWSIESKQNSYFGKLEEWFSGHSLEDFCKEKGWNENLIEFFKKAEKDKIANERVKKGCLHLGLAFANTIILLDPAKLIIGGGIGFNQYETIYPIIDNTLKKALPDSIYREDILEKASLEPYGVVIGGAYLAQKELLLSEIYKTM